MGGTRAVLRREIQKSGHRGGGVNSFYFVFYVSLSLHITPESEVVLLSDEGQSNTDFLLSPPLNLHFIFLDSHLSGCGCVFMAWC